MDQNRLGRDFGEHLKGSLVPRIKKSQIDVSFRQFRIFNNYVTHSLYNNIINFVIKETVITGFLVACKSSKTHERNCE